MFWCHFEFFYFDWGSISPVIGEKAFGLIHFTNAICHLLGTPNVYGLCSNLTRSLYFNTYHKAANAPLTVLYNKDPGLRLWNITKQYMKHWWEGICGLSRQVLGYSKGRRQEYMKNTSCALKNSYNPVF